MIAVDVLDREIATAEALAGSDAYHAERLPKLREAHAAVAELRDAATSGRAQLRDVISLLGMAGFSDAAMHCEAISDHLDAALAPFGEPA